jgi:hypothetical protein
MPDEDQHLDEPNPLPSEGSTTISQTSVKPGQVSGAPFPPFEIAGDALTQRNEDRVPPVPIGPPRGPSAPTSEGTVPFKPKTNVNAAASEGTPGEKEL